MGLFFVILLIRRPPSTSHPRTNAELPMHLLLGALCSLFCHVFIVLTMPSSAAHAQGGSSLEADSAVRAYNAKDFKRAIEWGLKAVEINDASRDAWRVLGYSAREVSDYDLMVRSGARLIKIVPNERHGWYLSAIGNYRKGRYLESIEPMKELCRMEPATCVSSGLNAILASFSQDAVGLRDSTFSIVDGLSITLPKSWHRDIKINDSTGNVSAFITLENLAGGTDAFSAGAVFNWMRQIGETFRFDFKENNAQSIIKFWTEIDTKQTAELPLVMWNVTDSASMKIGEWSGFTRTVELQLKSDPRPRTAIQCFLAKPDELLILTLECGSPEWLIYRPRFRSALGTLRLP